MGSSKWHRGHNFGGMQKLRMGDTPHLVEDNVFLTENIIKNQNLKGGTHGGVCFWGGLQS